MVRKKRRTAIHNGPDPVDIHVGQRIRLLRVLRGLSQSALGEMLGLTFQQVQKYERGTNRVSASKLWHVSEALDVPVSYFFDGLSRREDAPTAPAKRPTAAIDVHLFRDLKSLSPNVRQAINKLVKAMTRIPADGADS